MGEAPSEERRPTQRAATISDSWNGQQKRQIVFAFAEEAA
jgi:hypothetical protein